MNSNTAALPVVLLCRCPPRAAHTIHALLLDLDKAAEPHALPSIEPENVDPLELMAKDPQKRVGAHEQERCNRRGFVGSGNSDLGRLAGVGM
jgi:hypothetical protein